MKENENIAKEGAIPEGVALLLQELSKELGIDNGSPEDISREVKKRRLKESIAKRAKENNAKKRYRSLLLEAKALSKCDADFDLERELNNPLFSKFVRCGFDVTTAYKLTHIEDIIEKAKLEAEQAGYEKAVAHLRSGALRPEENGIREQAGISEKKNVASLTGGGIRDILRRVEKGAKVKF